MSTTDQITLQKSTSRVARSVKSSSSAVLTTRTALLSEHYGLCRICLDEAHRNNLIAPCNCRGSHAYVHKHCLRRWFESAPTPACEICKKKYKKRSIGLKPYSEWKWPKPLGNSQEDKLDFYAAIVWMIFATRVLFMFCTYGTDESMKYLTVVLGRGVLRTFWFATYFFNTVYYSHIGSKIFGKWWNDHQIYEWDFMEL